MIISIAWRNLWRKSFRSLIIMNAISVGIFAGLILVAFSKGLTEQRISQALNTEIGHIQIHRPDFIVREDFNLIIPNCDSINHVLNQIPEISGYSSRLIINSIASSAETGTNVKIVGVDPEQEKCVSELHNKLIEGNYFEKNKSVPVIIGLKLAEKLKVKLNSKILLQMRDENDNITPGVFRIGGIFKTSNSVFDEYSVFILKSDFVRFTGIDSASAHEIVIFLKDFRQSPKIRGELNKLFSALEIKSWKELDVILNFLSDEVDQYFYLLMVFILIALIFGIINTMIMSVLERIKELGVLMAIGMTRLRIVKMILFETVFLTLSGAVIGIIAGLAFIKYFGQQGVNLSIWSKGFEHLGFNPIIYTTIEPVYVFITAILVVLTGLLAAVFPIVKTIKLDIVEALRSK